MITELIRKSKYSLALGFSCGCLLSVIVLVLAVYGVSGLEVLSIWLKSFSDAGLIMTCLGFSFLGGILGSAVGVTAKHILKWFNAWRCGNDSQILTRQSAYQTIQDELADTPPVIIGTDQSLTITANSDSSPINPKATTELNPDLEEFRNWCEKAADALYAKVMSDGKEAVEELLTEKMSEFKKRRKPLLVKYHPDTSGSDTKGICQNLLDMCEQMMKRWQLALAGNMSYKGDASLLEQKIADLKKSHTETHNLFDLITKQQEKIKKQQVELVAIQDKIAATQGKIAEDLETLKKNKKTRYAKEDQQIEAIREQFEFSQTIGAQPSVKKNETLKNDNSSNPIFGQ